MGAHRVARKLPIGLEPGVGILTTGQVSENSLHSYYLGNGLVEAIKLSTLSPTKKRRTAPRILAKFRFESCHVGIAETERLDPAVFPRIVAFGCS